MSILTSLPIPKHSFTTTAPRSVSQEHGSLQSTPLYLGDGHSQALVSTAKVLPPYGSRDGYIPREPVDFGDGGAFPEIHVKQYPLDMGRGSQSSSSGRTVALRVDSSGKVRYDGILKEGRSAIERVQSTWKEQMAQDNVDEDMLARPNSEAVDQTTEETRLAMQQFLANASGNDLDKRKGKDLTMPTVVRYTAKDTSQNGAQGGKSRLIQVYEAPTDPLEPPKFRHGKLPVQPPSPPVPVMHSPPRQITREDQSKWKIPPCVSMWKNSRGFTRPLHHLMANDGRSLMRTKTISEGFPQFAEALAIAERQARMEVSERAKLALLNAQREDMQKEKRLEEMARAAALGGVSGGGIHDVAMDDKDKIGESEKSPSNQSSMRKAGIGAATISSILNERIEEDKRETRRSPSAASVATMSSSDSGHSGDERQQRRAGGRRMEDRRSDRGRVEHSREERGNGNAFDGRRGREPERGRREREPQSERGRERVKDERERIRDERRAERERIRNETGRELEREMRNERRKGGEKSERQRERHITERMALGELTAGTKGVAGIGGLHDTRLFDRQSGLAQGFEVDDSYNVYDEPLFGRSQKGLTTAGVYRPKEVHTGAGFDESLKFEKQKEDKAESESESSSEDEEESERERLRKLQKARETAQQEFDAFGMSHFKERERKIGADNGGGQKGGGFMFAAGGSSATVPGAGDKDSGAGIRAAHLSGDKAPKFVEAKLDDASDCGLPAGLKRFDKPKAATTAAKRGDEADDGGDGDEHIRRLRERVKRDLMKQKQSGDSYASRGKHRRNATRNYSRSRSRSHGRGREGYGGRRGGKWGRTRRRSPQRGAGSNRSFDSRRRSGGDVRSQRRRASYSRSPVRSRSRSRSRSASHGRRQRRSGQRSHRRSAFRSRSRSHSRESRRHRRPYRR